MTKQWATCAEGTLPNLYISNWGWSRGLPFLAKRWQILKVIGQHCLRWATRAPPCFRRAAQARCVSMWVMQARGVFKGEQREPTVFHGEHREPGVIKGKQRKPTVFQGEQRKPGVSQHQPGGFQHEPWVSFNKQHEPQCKQREPRRGRGRNPPVKMLTQPTRWVEQNAKTCTWPLHCSNNSVSTVTT